jgi:hypothetical protein
MFDTRRKSTGINRTPALAFFTVAFIFSPPVLFVSRPFGSAPSSLGVTQ